MYAGRAMKAYEESRYTLWREHAENVVANLLKRNLLIKASSKVTSVYMDKEAFDKVSSFFFRITNPTILACPGSAMDWALLL